MTVCGGCCSQGCHGYVLCLFAVPSPIPSNVEGFYNIIHVNLICFFFLFYVLPLLLQIYQKSVNNLEDFS